MRFDITRNLIHDKMDSFKERLYVEQKELQSRLQKLIEFIGSDRFEMIEDVQKKLLNMQVKAMDVYNKILLERIKIL